MKLGFIGFGEAGYSIAEGLKKEGLKDITAYDVALENEQYKPLIEKRAQESGVTIVKKIESIFESDIIFSALPADVALTSLKNIKEDIKKNQLYIDVSAADPNDKRSMQVIVNNKHALFVDGAMTGRLVVDKHKVPILASGTGVDQFIEKMSRYNMNIKKVSDNAGDATSIKLIRSIFMKGYAVLCIEMLEAAKKLEVDNLVIEGISHTMNDRNFENSMNKLVTGTSIHSRRRSVELEGTLDLLKELGVNSIMSNAVSEKLKLITSYGLKEEFKGQPPEDWSQVINSIINIENSKNKRGTGGI
ncbi:NAD(P)-binding domain-containing protein [Oceanobacillus jeddahense]|uniref:NAD(P)-binding domain-containing protein n=1 Tax=Oceanobacillus jeddahense TaxID=1462527 RepID=UPI0006941401|nr:NAD(P)-binding domain-containing protein [Oceanobacillus jeddahense]